MQFKQLEDESPWTHDPARDDKSTTERVTSPPTASKRRKRRGGKPALNNQEPTGAEAAAHNFLHFSFGYLCEVLSTALRALKMPISITLALVIFSQLWVPFMQHQMRLVLSPICSLPFLSRVSFCVSLPDDIPKRADYPRLMKIQEESFDHLLEDTAGGSRLALKLSEMQMAVGDLISLISVSELTSRDTLVGTLQNFIKDAQETGESLHTLGANVGGAVDTITASNDYALRTIQAATKKEESFALMYIPWPFKPHGPSRQAVTKSFSQAMTILSKQMKRLVLQAELSLHNLKRLESRLDTIRDIVQPEFKDKKEECDEVLGTLWTTFGGNRKRIKNLEENKQLLDNVGTYRKLAREHVMKALETLKKMRAQMVELSSQVTAPELLEEDEIPLEVHIQSIRKGIERLHKSRERSKKNDDKVFEGLGTF